MLRIEDGESMVAICADEGMPAPKTVRAWRAADAAKRTRNAQARVAQAETIADSVIDVVGQVLAGKVAPDAARVAIDAKKWLAGKLDRGTYGDAPTTINVGVAVDVQGFWARLRGTEDGERIEER